MTEETKAADGAPTGVSDSTQLLGSKNVYGYCPGCRLKTLEVSVNKSGVSFSPDCGSVHWFEGDGLCHNCGWNGEYSDQSA